MSDGAAAGLDRTLEEAGLPIRSDRIEILAHSDADPNGNARVHGRTNERIHDLLSEGRLGTCIHITGTARALVDPFHRELCNLMRREGDEPFRILYKLPEDRRGDMVSTVAYNLDRWASKGATDWRTKYLAIGTIGDGAVDLVATSTIDPFQYSVFGNEYVQLQGRHKATAKSKEVWLLRSGRLNELLAERGLDLLRKADDVKESWFARFRLTLNSVTATYMMRYLAKHGALDRDGLLGERRLEDLPDDPSEVLAALSVMGLVGTDGSTLTLLPDGRDFLEAT